MNYTTHTRYKGLVLNRATVNIPAKTTLEANDTFILYGDVPICTTTSEVAKMHFARNDDGRGMERGALTHAIAYSNRKRMNKTKTARQRFTDAEIETITTKYQRFIREDCEFIIFNDAFFAAEVEELREMAKDLHIHVKEVKP